MTQSKLMCLSFGIECELTKSEHQLFNFVKNKIIFISTESDKMKMMVAKVLPKEPLTQNHQVFMTEGNVKTLSANINMNVAD